MRGHVNEGIRSVASRGRGCVKKMLALHGAKILISFVKADHDSSRILLDLTRARRKNVFLLWRSDLLVGPSKVYLPDTKNARHTPDFCQLFAWKNHLEFLSLEHSKKLCGYAIRAPYWDEKFISKPALSLIAGEIKLILSYSK